MRRTLVILSGLLVLQAAVAIGLALSRPDYGAFQASEPLLAFDAAAVQEVAIDEGGGESVMLRRNETGWRLPELYDFPASEEEVTDLLQRLNDLKKGLPVAVSGSAPKRFKLTDSEHERRIVLRGNDETLGEVIFGSSPTYRQVHAKTPDDAAVYSVAFATYDAGSRPEDWIDRDYLNLAEEEISRVEMPSFALVREDGGIVVEGLSAEEETVESEANKIVGQLARPGFTAVEGRGEEALARVATPDLTVTLERKAGAALTYRLKKLDDKDEYLMTSSDHDYLFRVPKYALQAVLDASREKLVKPMDAEDGSAQSSETAPRG